MRALHLQSGLPLLLWPIILTVAIDILNMTSNKVSPNSPYHAVFQRKPNILSLHPFGCKAFWLKLNADTGRTIVRRDIRVHDKIFPLVNHILSVRTNNRLVIDNAFSGPKAEG